MNEILLAREHRSEHIKQLIDTYIGKTIAVLKLNVVGENKNPEYMRFICLLFDKYLNDEFGIKIEKHERVSSMDGDYIYYVINETGNLVKERTIYIEDHHYFGRLVDIDVYHKRGISREDMQCEMRKCLICDNYAHICSRNKTHSTEEIHAKVHEIIMETLSQIVLTNVMSQIHFELELYPRFGLVSKVDSGAHKDMNYDTFVESTFAIKPFIKKFIDMGLNEIKPKELQKIGLNAEEAMFEATNGVNTQKGLIFALGVFLPAFMKCIVENKSKEELIEEIKVIAKEIIGNYFDVVDKKNQLSHGDRIFLDHGIKGIRGEALNGFQLIFKEMPNAKESLYDPYDCLIYIMSELDDTTIIHRKGLSTLRKVQSDMKELILKGGYINNKEKYNQFSETYKKKSISPGGSSDLMVLKLIYENLKYLLR